MILLQIDPTFSDEPKTVCEVYYKIEYTCIFAWFLVLDVGHYHWLCGPIRRLPPNNKANYPIHAIRCILNFL
jgi:hypothetical protein